MALKLSLLLQAVDRISAPVRRVQESVQRMGDRVERAARKVDRASAPMSRLGSKVDALRGKMLGMLVAANRAAGPNGIDLLGRASDKAGFAVGRLIRKMGGAAVGLAKWGAAAGAGATGFALFDMFQTAGQFEDFEIMLTNLEGSSEKARQSMAWVQKFAEKTPYSLEEVMEAFVQLKAYGIDPMGGALVALGDTAAGMNKRLMDAVEALADAETGEFERLKSFAIRTKVEGDKVTFSYQKNGKAIEKVAKNQSAAIRGVLIEVMGGKFLGMMDQKSKGFNGLVRNMGDKWTQFLNMVADAGVFDKVKGRLEQILARVDQMAADGTLQDWAQRIGDKLEEAFDWGWKFVDGIKWEDVGSDLERAATAAGKLADAILTIASATGKVKRGGANITYGMDWLFLGSREADKNWERMYPDEKRRPTDYEQRRQRRLKSGSQRPAGMPPLTSPRATMPRPKLPNSPRASADKVQVGGKATLVVDVRGQASARMSDFTKTGDVPWSIQIARSNGKPA